MSQLTQRNIEILKIIIEEYIKTGNVLGSKLLLKKYDLGVSSATVRSDMATLERLELLYQPYNSAGRLPTAKGLRAFVNYMMQQTPEFFLEEHNTHSTSTLRELSDFIYTLVHKLSHNTGEIAFFVLPDKHICEYNGVSHFLEKNKNRLDDDGMNLIKMLENKPNFSTFIASFPLRNGVNILIGEENILPYLKDYTIILKSLEIDESTAYIGIIGSLQMDYSFNVSAVKGII
ncbi:hypothetical protein LAT59_02865 [Candidatus Gracilibacteria bacterium]|nr:hypothetical protein [Candidatus Gracilibacteria bacterium]